MFDLMKYIIIFNKSKKKRKYSSRQFHKIYDQQTIIRQQ